MRRIASLLFLLAFAFTQAPAVECPMASASAASTGGAAQAMHGMAHHGGDHADTNHPGPRHSHAPGQHAECGIVMSCGAAVVAVGEISVAPLAASSAALPWRPALYASPFIATVSPPPRFAIPA